jgi:hypothetical protein
MPIETTKPLMPEVQVPIWWPIAFGYTVHIIASAISDSINGHYILGPIGVTFGIISLSFLCFFPACKPKIVWRWVTIRSEEFPGEFNNTPEVKEWK